MQGLARAHDSLLDEVLRAAQLEEQDPTQLIYLALAEALDPPAVTLGTSFHSREKIAATMCDTVHGILHGTPGYCVGIAEVQHPGWRSGARPTALVRSPSRWGKAALRKMGSGSFVAVQIGLSPAADQQEGFIIETRLRALIFSMSRQHTEREIAKLERRPLDEKPEIRLNWMKPNERRVAAACALLLCAQDPLQRTSKTLAQELGLIDWPSRAAVRHRYRFLTLARCPLSKIFFGVGFAQHRARALINDENYAARQGAKLAQSPIHNDEVASFAWEEALRLDEFTLRLPHVELR